MEVESLILAYGAVAVFVLMIANGFSMFPSSQFLYIACGWAIHEGYLPLVPVILAGALGNTIGNILLYEVTRRKGLEYILRLKLFPEREIQKVEIAFRMKGAFFLFVGKLLPSIKVFVPVVAGIGRADRKLFALLMFLSSLIWTIPFLAIGYVLGKSSDFFAQYVVILMVVALIVIWGFYRYINSASVKQALEAQTNAPTERHLDGVDGRETR